MQPFSNETCGGGNVCPLAHVCGSSGMKGQRVFGSISPWAWDGVQRGRKHTEIHDTQTHVYLHRNNHHSEHQHIIMLPGQWLDLNNNGVRVYPSCWQGKDSLHCWFVYKQMQICSAWRHWNRWNPEQQKGGTSSLVHDHRKQVYWKLWVNLNLKQLVIFTKSDRNLTKTFKGLQ